MRVSDNTNYFETPASYTVAGFLLKRLSDGISATKALLHERLIDDRFSGEALIFTKIAALNKGNPHRSEEAGRNREEIGQHLRRLSVHPDEAVPSISIEEWPASHGYVFDARHVAQLCRRLIPYLWRLGLSRGNRQNREILGGISCRLVGEVFEGLYKQSGGEINHKAERDLSGDKRQHQTPARLPHLSFERLGRLDLRNAQGGYS